MVFKLLYTKTAVNDISKIDVVAKKRIKKKVEEYAANPLRYAQKLTDYRLGEYRWRIGNYRVVFDMKGKSIIILRVRHRREVYR